MDHILVPLRRIILLQGLEQATGQELSNEMLQRLLKANGQHGFLAEVNEQINWLENQGYVKMIRLGESSFILVHFTRPGGIRMGRKAP
ncbi:MAG: hypothetical protein LBB80_00080 [Treponema sp.]|jgi:Fe2+ or Zn2+ uptake regulation protein|nr:hypothetical protein [Treponema sp.]